MKSPRSFPARMGLVGVLAALVLAALLPATAAAATRPITFELNLGGSCISGRVSDRATLKVIWRSSAGVVKVKETIRAGSMGYWEACSSPSRLLKSGDQIKVTVGTTVRKFVVPKLSLNLDRVNDVFNGKAPAGTKVHLTYPAGLFADYVLSKTVTARADGTWRYKPSGFDIMGGLYASIGWTSAKKDSIAVDGVAPSLTATLGSSVVTGVSKPKATVKATLFNATTMAVRATAKGVANRSGGFSVRFLDSAGDKVAVKAGNRLRATSVAADADWIVPGAQVAADVAGDIVTGRCRDAGTSARSYWVRVSAPGDSWRGEAIGSVDAKGYFEIDFADPTMSEGGIFYEPADIRSGDTIELRCLQATGDWVRLTHTVP
jgi:hypothetical protein